MFPPYNANIRGAFCGQEYYLIQAGLLYKKKE